MYSAAHKTKLPINRGLKGTMQLENVKYQGGMKDRDKKTYRWKNATKATRSTDVPQKPVLQLWINHQKRCDLEVSRVKWLELRGESNITEKKKEEDAVKVSIFRISGRKDSKGRENQYIAWKKNQTWKELNIGGKKNGEFFFFYKEKENTARTINNDSLQPWRDQ